jgi:pyruvate/2-oxoglutarate/acetoin dehydrogenase E1 component
VVDLRTLVPLDEETVISSVKKTGNLLVVDEDYQSYGVTGEVISRVVEHDPTVVDNIDRLAIPDVPIPFARSMENEVLPDVEDIIASIRDMDL